MDKKALEERLINFAVLIKIVNRKSKRTVQKYK